MMTSKDLYERAIAGRYVKLCGGGTDTDGTMEDCFALAPLDGGGYAVSDSEHPELPPLRFTRQQLLNAADQIPGLV